MGELRVRFKQNYRGMVEAEFGEDFAMYRNLCKNIRSYLKKPTLEKSGAIYNKILLCSRFFHKDFLYEHLTTELETVQQNEFMIYVISNFFDISYKAYSINSHDILNDSILSYFETINN